jgi:4-amino-4-deoxy-L-arabinose transferase-like glycosyltransferase
MQDKDLLNIATWLFILAITSFFLSLFLPYIGEEGVYTISSYEMWYHHHYLYATTYGLPYWRPPLFNWLIICFASIIGWEHMLVASRLVTALATIATSFMLMWLTNRLFKRAYFGLFAALIYLTSDALFYHGWLAYSDPLFSFFVVSAISLLWVAGLEQRYVFVWLSVIALIAAFMAKALTAYVFYITSFICIVYFNGKLKSFLLKPFNILPYLLSIFFYFFWSIASHRITARGMWIDIFSKFHTVYWIGYIQQLIVFPLEVFFRFLPASGVAIYYFVKRKYGKIKFNLNLTLSGIILLNFIPYWLAPHTNIRYILPLYPFIALLLAIRLWHLPKRQFKIILLWLTLAILLKYIEIVVMHYYQLYYRGNYTQIAKQLILQTKNFPVYSNNSVATGLAVTAEIDRLVYPSPPLRYTQFAKEEDYFVINDKTDSKLGKLYKHFKLGKQGTAIYLLCQGRACYSH